MQSDRCLSVCLSVCLSSVTIVYCGQMVRWFRMQLGAEVGLGSGNIVLDRDPTPNPKNGGGGTAPNFWPMSVMAKCADGLRCQLVRR